MQSFMTVVGILAWLFAVMVFGDARSAIHEIEALMAALIGTVAFVGVGTMAAIERLHPTKVAAKEAADRKAAEAKFARQQQLQQPRAA